MNTSTTTTLQTHDGNAAQAADAENATAPTAAKPARFISKKEMLARVGVSYPTLWVWMQRPPGQGAFPRSRELGGKVYWLEAEIEAWILSRPIRRLKGDR
jgi:predicted DNA-binding transcriptional regulator AlpA